MKPTKINTRMEPSRDHIIIRQKREKGVNGRERRWERRMEEWVRRRAYNVGWEGTQRGDREGTVTHKMQQRDSEKRCRAENGFESLKKEKVFCEGQIGNI